MILCHQADLKDLGIRVAQRYQGYLQNLEFLVILEILNFQVGQEGPYLLVHLWAPFVLEYQVTQTVLVVLAVPLALMIQLIQHCPVYLCLQLVLYFLVVLVAPVSQAGQKHQKDLENQPDH